MSNETNNNYFNTHSGVNESVLLKYVPVTLYGPRGKVETFAFIDDGSTSTFMDHGLMDELGLEGTPHPIQLHWTGDVTREERDSVQLSVKISGRQGSATPYLLTDVHTVKELALPRQSVNTSQLAAKYQHLRGLQLPSYADAAPRILIGIDNCILGRSLKCVEGKWGQPIVSKTRLGWVAYGPCPIATNTPGVSLQAFHTRVRESSVDLVAVELNARSSPRIIDVKGAERRKVEIREPIRVTAVPCIEMRFIENTVFGTSPRCTYLRKDRIVVLDGSPGCRRKHYTHLPIETAKEDGKQDKHRSADNNADSMNVVRLIEDSYTHRNLTRIGRIDSERSKRITKTPAEKN